MHHSLRRRTLAFSYFEGALWAVMVGSAENFSLYYAVKRGLNPREVALISTVPVLFGALFNWLIPLLTPTRWLKRGVLICVLVQVIGLAILTYSVSSQNYFWWIFSGLALYWIGGMGASPLWIDWVSGWLPIERFGRFYSRRSATLALITLTTFISSALVILNAHSLNIFVGIFALGFLARAFSGLFLFIQSSPPPTEHEEVSAKVKPSSWSMRNVMLVLAFACVFKFVASISTPFFLPYMVDQLKFNVFQVAIINGMSFVGLAILFPSFGEAIRSFQPLIGLQVAMMMAAANCIAWTFVEGTAWIACLQFFAGLYWAVFDLSCILIIQSKFPKFTRKYLGFFMALATLATVGGSLFGSRLLELGSSYFQVFQISAYLRFVIGALLIATFFFSKTLRVPIKTYGSFLRRAMQVNLSTMEVRRLLLLFRRRS